ncbi:hypothetical protein [Aliivibrio kagoshimensis]|uniref:hypothetical protein n=1 Tax=Aliivibrio kagoshimensis TaxID=2910230 RepID=UPI003D14801C
MDMAAMDMAVLRRVVAVSIISLCPIGDGFAKSEQNNFEPSVGVDILFTDNRDRTASNAKNGQVTTFNLGADLEITGSQNSFTMEYIGRQLIDHQDSDRNSFYNELQLDNTFRLPDSGLEFGLHGSIDNLADELDTDATTDIFSGTTIESKSLSTDVNFSSNPRKRVKLEAFAELELVRNEDTIADNNNVDSRFNITNGSAEKQYFGELDYSYEQSNSAASSSSDKNVVQELYAEFGLQPKDHWSPLFRYSNENLSSNSAESAESNYLGAGTRYFLDKKSYLELTYNIPNDRETNDNYVGGAINMEASARTKLYVEYSRRFFGDAYELEFTHQSRRLKNNISYTEEPTSFNRKLLVGGNESNQLSLLKELEWTSTLDLKRGFVEFSARSQNTKNIEDGSTNTEFDSVGTTIEWQHKLSRSMTLTNTFDYDKYDFFGSANPDKTDHYRIFKSLLEQTFNNRVTAKYTLEYSNRDSSEIVDNYDELRVSFNLNKHF